jgi:hypothetical protein
MAAIALTNSSVVVVKNALRDEFPGVKSSHITEALASGLGFRTHAALQAALGHEKGDAPYALLDTEKALQRLQTLGYPLDPEFDFELLVGRAPEVISTMPESAYDIEYNSARKRAWRNLMVCAVNAGLAQKLFTLRPGDNRFSNEDGMGQLFDFLLPNGLPARGWVGDAGFDELSVHAAVNPKGTWVRTANGGFSAGDAFAGSWVERQRGAWLQTADTSFACRKSLLGVLAALDVLPQGYGDRGRVIM